MQCRGRKEYERHAEKGEKKREKGEEKEKIYKISIKGRGGEGKINLILTLSDV